MFVTAQMLISESIFEVEIHFRLFKIHYAITSSGIKVLSRQAVAPESAFLSLTCMTDTSMGKTSMMFNSKFVPDTFYQMRTFLSLPSLLKIL